MKVYLAAPYGARDLLREYSAELKRVGFKVTSTWLDESHEINEQTTGPASGLPDAQVALHAAADLGDIDISDLLVVFTAASVGVKSASGGRHVETGYAIALSKPVLVVGEPENVFHRYPRACTVVPNWHEALIELSSRLVTSERDQDRVMAG